MSNSSYPPEKKETHAASDAEGSGAEDLKTTGKPPPSTQKKSTKPGRRGRSDSPPSKGTGKTKTRADESDALRDRIEELEDRHLRLRAEYENYVRRTNDERLIHLKYAAFDTIKTFLPIADDLQRVIDAAQSDGKPDTDPVVKGVGMVLTKFIQSLESQGVQPFKSVGELFDPELHDALMSRASADHPPGTVLEEYEVGYKYQDKVIRHAKVIVSS